MASLSTRLASSSSSSSSIPRRTYDVFLSFYGKDTRNGFVDHLHAALQRKGINVFKDDENLKHGENISQELLKVIEESQYAVVVISKNYAFSRWCLAELTKILECKTQTEMKILPIFYYVDPSDVRRQKRTFAEAFIEHIEALKVDKEQWETWKAALKEVGNLVGWHVYDRPEAKVVEEISANIFLGLSCNFSNISKDLIGVKSQVEELMTLLCIGCDDVRYVGIYGMGGIGKTTIAKLIYETISLQFEASSFLAIVGQEVGNPSLVYLQKQLIYEILKDKNIEVWNHYRGIQIIANRFTNKKVLIVIDDVDGKEQVEALVGNHDWFGPGSRIILTSRDHHLLTQYVDFAYEVKNLNNNEALELFSWKAFKTSFPPKDYLDLSRDIVGYAFGLPLAIEVFGSSFFGRSMDAWRSGRDLFKANPNKKILDKLKISFDGLEDMQKQLFLDIVCFFNNDYLTDVIPILETFGYYPNFNIEVLISKSLLKIKDGHIHIHALLEKMGKQIVYGEPPKEVGRRSRLWHYEDIIHVLKNNTSTSAIESIRLFLYGENLEVLNLEAFSNMNMLRMIEIIPNYPESISELDFEIDGYFLRHTTPDIFWYSRKWLFHKNTFKMNLRGSHPLELMPKRFEEGLGKLKWIGDPSKFKLSDKLYLISWFQYPLHSLPATFQSRNLVGLILPCSHVKILWSGSKNFEKLRVIYLNYSKDLIETPNFTEVPNLEQLRLSHCTNLLNIHPSIGSLKQLRLLDLSGCKSLKNLPESLGGMQSLELLDMSKTAIKQLPSSIVLLKELKFLHIGGTLLNLESFLLPKSVLTLSSLRYLDLQYCNLSDGMFCNNFDSVSSLKGLILNGNNFTKVPEFVYQLYKLEVLGLSNCRSFPSLSMHLLFLRFLRCLDLSYCNIFDGGIFDDLSYLSLLETLDLSGNKFTKISDSLSQLPKLSNLNLEDNSQLQALPKLPLVIRKLIASNCPLLKTFEVEMGSLDVLCKNHTFGVTYFGHGLPYKIVYSSSGKFTISEVSLNVQVDVACGSTWRPEIPGWFKMRSYNPFGKIQISMTASEFRDFYVGFSLSIVYEMHESSYYRGCDDNNPPFLEVFCQARANSIVNTIDLVRRAVELPPTGANGFWVFLQTNFISRFTRQDPIGRLPDTESMYVDLWISTSNPNIKVKDFGAHAVSKPAIKNWCQLLYDTSVCELTLESFESIFRCMTQPGPSIITID